jgi:hypothetical protein
MDKGLRDREKFRKDILEVMKNHGLTSATIQYVTAEKKYCDYDDFVVSGLEESIDELNRLINAQQFSLYHSEEVLKALEVESKKDR